MRFIDEYILHHSIPSEKPWAAARTAKQNARQQQTPEPSRDNANLFSPRRLENAMLMRIPRLRIEFTFPSKSSDERGAYGEIKVGVLAISRPTIRRVTGYTAISNCDGVWCPDDGPPIVDVNSILLIDVDNDEQAAEELAEAIEELARNAYESHGCPQQLIQINTYPIRQLVVTHAAKATEEKSTEKAAA